MQWPKFPSSPGDVQTLCAARLVIYLSGGIVPGQVCPYGHFCADWQCGLTDGGGEKFTPLALWNEKKAEPKAVQEQDTLTTAMEDMELVDKNGAGSEAGEQRYACWKGIFPDGPEPPSKSKRERQRQATAAGNGSSGAGGGRQAPC